MSWFAVGGAVVGLAGSYMQSRQANKKKTSHTDQTTTQDPYLAGQIGPDIDQILAYQRGLASRGAPRVDRRGNVYYDELPAGGVETPMPKFPTRQPTGGGPGNRPGGPEGPSGGYTELTRPSGNAGLKSTRGGKKKSGGKGGGAAGTTGPNLTTPQGVFEEVARRGLETGNTETVNQARNVMGNIFGAAGREGSAAEGEETGFEGYNPILDRLAGTLEGDVEDRVGRDLLLGFLDEDKRGGGRSGGGTGGGGGGSNYQSINMDSVYRSAYGAPVAGPGGGGAGPGGGVPDTMVPESFFGTETRKIFDEEANNAELQALIDSMNEDVERGMFEDIAQLDAASAGAGRFGGDMWKGMSRDAREEALQEMLKTSSQVRVGDRESRRQARLAALAGVNTRDLGLLGANVQREGIAANERAAGAASAASAGAMADQLALAKRGQDLSAIGALMDAEQFSLGQLGDVGGQLSSDRLSSLGMVPGLEGIGLSGLQTTLGAGEGMTALRGQDIQRQIANRQAGIASRGLDQQLGMFNAGQGQAVVNDYLRTIMGIGGMGGTSRTVGTNVQPGLGISTTGAMLQGAAGGAATGAGLYMQGRGAGMW